MAEDIKIGSGTSLITRSAKNLSASIKMVEDVEVGDGDGGDDKTVGRSPLSKKSNVPIENFTFLHSGKNMSFSWYFWLWLRLLVKGTT